MKLTATCACCGTQGSYETSHEEDQLLKKYYKGETGFTPIQELFPKVPQWIRAGAIDKKGNGFCICPDFAGMWS